jgi:hypothetical protein
VYGFSTSKRAAEEFEQQQKDPAFSEWPVPDAGRGLLGSSTQHQIVCGAQHQIPMCKAIIQYDNYFIYFNMHMWPEEATETDLVVLLQEIDGRMSQCLSGTPIPQND